MIEDDSERSHVVVAQTTEFWHGDLARSDRAALAEDWGLVPSAHLVAPCWL